jgi:acetyl esterase/lipase
MKNRYVRYLMSLVILLAFLHTPARAQGDPTFGYGLQLDVVYGQGKIAPDGNEQMRDLKMDIYTPTNAGSGPWPAVVYVHGGAYHRGGRRLAPFKEAGAVHARPEDWARLLTPLGYICFVIEYRLAPELPQPDHMPATGNLLPVDKVVTPPGIARTNYVRRAMSLPEISSDTAILAWNAAMAGAEDTAKAVHYVHDNAEALGVDPDRIALGGHSAGAGNVLNATYGLRAPVAAAFPFSAPELIIDWDKTDLSGLPPALVVASQFDIDAVLEALPDTTDNLRGAGVETSLAWIPGFPHFYPTGAVSLGDDGTRMSIGDRVAKFLDKHLKQ